MRLIPYILRELLNNRRFCFLFVLNLSFGLTGLIALDGFKLSLEKTIKSQSKAVLGADFGISARRPISDGEKETLVSLLSHPREQSSFVEVFSMVANAKKQSRLVQIKAIEENYPFYGKIGLEKAGSAGQREHFALKKTQSVWIYPELAQQLKLKVGDTLSIGESRFRVDDIVTADSAAGITTNMAPRVYINRAHLDETGLIKKGSIAWHHIVYKLPGRDEETLNGLRDDVFKSIDSPEVKVFTHEDSSARLATLISRLNDFLGLASLVALFLAAVGSAFLFRSYFKSKTKEVATLICLGASRFKAFSYYLIQIIFLGLLSSLVATLLSLLIVPGLGRLTQDLLPFQIQFSLNLSTILMGTLIGTLGSFFICLPILINLKDLKPSVLLYENRAMGRVSILSLLAGLPGLLMFWGLAVWLSHSYKVGSLFTGLFVVSGLIMALASWLLFWQLGKWSRVPNLSLRWALRDLSRNRLTTVVCFISIGLGSLLLNLIPQLEKSIGAELERPEQSKVPSLFMFDIQEDQVGPFKEVLEKQNVPLDNISPMVRARLIKVNGKSFDKGSGSATASLSREQENEMRFRNRGFNLSYRARLSEAESIAEGRDFQGTYDETGAGLPEVSVESRFAERLNLKLGDELLFEVESIPIKGKIVNLRKVKWTSFQPNFFVQFQPGVLDMAPKTFIATVPTLPLAKKNELQNKLVEELPNISMVDVSRVVESISDIMDQMAWALTFMSILCLFAGFVVIYSIANHQAAGRRWEIGLLKSLGASFATIRAQFLWQFVLISFAATALGAIISLAVSYFISRFLFDGLWLFDWVTPVASLAVGVAVTYAVTDLATRNALQMKTRDLFSD